MLSTAKDILKMTRQPKQRAITAHQLASTPWGDKDAFLAIIEKMLENSINIPPTLYKNQGDIIGIMVGRDIDFSKVYQLQMKQ